MLYIILQILIALVLIGIMAIVSYGMYNRDVYLTLQNLRIPYINSYVKKDRVVILDGTYGFDKNLATFNTVDSDLGNFKDISPSVNQRGGAVYTYNFWLYLPSKRLDTNKTVVLFTKGSKHKMTYKSRYNCRSDTGWYMVKNPLVRVNINNGRLSAVVAEFNSIAGPDATHISPEDNVDCTSSNDNTKDANMFGMYGLEHRNDVKDNWNMITVVVSETNPSTDLLFRNKAVVKMYLNGYEYLNKSGEVQYSGNFVTTAMRNNMGNIYINPDEVGNENIGIADLTYFNYAISDMEIQNLHKMGFNNYVATIPNKNNFDMYSNTQTAPRDRSRSNVIKVF